MNKDTKRKKSNKKSDISTTNAQDKRNKEKKLSPNDFQETEESKGDNKPIGSTAQDIDERIKGISFGDFQDMDKFLTDYLPPTNSPQCLAGKLEDGGNNKITSDVQSETQSFEENTTNDIKETEEGKGDNKPIGSTAQDIDERIKGITFGDFEDIYKSSSDYFLPTNSPQCLAGKLEDGGNNKITSNVQSTTQSFVENTTNPNKSTTDICVNDPACDNQTAEKSKKKPRKRNKKNAKTDSNPSEGQEITSPSSVSEKDKNKTLDYDPNIVEYHPNILQRIKQLQPQSEPIKARSKSSKEMKKKLISDIKKKQTHFLTKVDGPDDLLYDDIGYASSIRPIIILMDKATQTDTLPQYPSITSFNDSKIDITLDSNSDTLTETKPTTSTLHQSIEEDKKTDSEEPISDSLI